MDNNYEQSTDNQNPYKSNPYDGKPNEQGNYGPGNYGQRTCDKENYGQAPYSQEPNNQNPYNRGNYSQSSYDQNPYDQNPYGQNPYDQNSYYQNPYDQNSYYQNPYDQNPNYYNDYNMDWNGGAMYDLPLDRNGNIIKNNFAAKLILSIFELVISPLFGVLALIFTCLQDESYKKRDWERFRNRKAKATIFLGIGYGITLMLLAGLAVLTPQIIRYMNKLTQSEHNYQEIIDPVDDVDADEDEWMQEPDEWEYYGSGPMAAPVDGMFSFTAQGVEIKMGMTVSELVDSGAELYVYDAELETLEIEPDDFAILYLDENWQAYVVAYNNTEDTIMAEDALLASATIYFWEDMDGDYLYMNDFGRDSTLEDLVELLGDQYDYQKQEDGWEYYSWNCEDGVVDVLFDNGELNNIDMNIWTQMW